MLRRFCFEDCYRWLAVFFGVDGCCRRNVKRIWIIFFLGVAASSGSATLLVEESAHRGFPLPFFIYASGLVGLAGLVTRFMAEKTTIK